MRSYVSKIKKLHPKEGDIFVVTLKGFPTGDQLARIKDEFMAMPFLKKNVFVIFVNNNVDIRQGRPHAGKHKVFLSNLEYLEYLSKKKGE